LLHVAKSGIFRPKLKDRYLKIDGKKQKIFQKNNILKIKKFDAKNIAILIERVITKVIIVTNKHANLLNH
jgi:hypothetical protein